MLIVSSSSQFCRRVISRAALSVFVAAMLGSAALAQSYTATILVSDIEHAGTFADRNLVNAWGLAASARSPWWVGDNGTGVSTLYDKDGVANPLVVTIPSASGSDQGTPTGVVFNGTQDFQIASGKPAAFLFATEDGTISGWNPNVDLHNAVIQVNNSGDSAVYKGLTLASAGGANFLYAANFHAGSIQVFDKDFKTHSFGAHAFVDASIPQGYAPFNVQEVSGLLVVTYAKQNAQLHDDVAGKGHGFVRIFSTDGRLLRRFQHVSALNSPWGISLAPRGFGKFSNHLLIGQFGSGAIAAFDLNGKFDEVLQDESGLALRIPGLWAIRFGNGAAAGPTNVLYFTAGPFEEAHGFFGRIQAR